MLGLGVRPLIEMPARYREHGGNLPARCLGDGDERLRNERQPDVEDDRRGLTALEGRRELPLTDSGQGGIVELGH